MLSMTGYGRATGEIDGRQMTVELKTVNHRFLDISFRMPRNLMFLEEHARKAISARLSRGHVDFFMTYRNLRSDAKTVAIDRALFQAYTEALDTIADSNLKDDRTLMTIARMPDVMTITEAEEDQEALKALLSATLAEALDKLIAMREREGLEMAADLNSRVDHLEAMVSQIEARYPETVQEYTKRLRASIEELIDAKVDETRLMTEVAIMADRSAIAEETVRLASHIRQLRECFGINEPIGRKLDFIVQELNREINTISSKSQDIPITRLAVDCKGEIEKLREQLQNVE